MNISIVIPNYNGQELLKKNLPSVVTSIASYKDGDVEILITDDASSDDSVKFAENFFKSIQQKNITGKVLQSASRKDGGFSKNVNRGVAKAKGEIVILLNSDVRPHKDFYIPLLAHFIDPNIFAVGCMDESIENGRIVLRGRGIGRWRKGFLVHKAGKVNKTTTLWVSGGSGAFRKSLWDTLGGLCELYNPFYWEDIDLSYRAQKAGFTIFFEQKSKVVHEHSTGTIQGHFKPFHIQKIVYRNQFLFVWVNATDFFLVFTHILLIPYYLATAAIDRNFAMIMGFGSALLLFPKALRQRQKNKKIFTRRDAEIEIYE